MFLFFNDSTNHAFRLSNPQLSTPALRVQLSTFDSASKLVTYCNSVHESIVAGIKYVISDPYVSKPKERCGNSETISVIIFFAASSLVIRSHLLVEISCVIIPEFTSKMIIVDCSTGSGDLFKKIRNHAKIIAHTSNSNLIKTKVLILIIALFAS